MQALLTAVALSMLLGPLLVRYNVRIADRILRRETSTPTGIALETAATREIARREHVIICGFGRVGQNLARVLERRGLEYIAIDLDSFRVRDARQAGDPVVFGDATQAGGVARAGTRTRQRGRHFVRGYRDTALRIVRSVRRLRTEVPVLVRTEDDSKLDALQAAGATEVVPEIFETSLSLVSHVLLFLRVPTEEVLATTEADPPRAVRDPAQRVPASRGSRDGRDTQSSPAAAHRGATAGRACRSTRPLPSWASTRAPSS